MSCARLRLCLAALGAMCRARLRLCLAALGVMFFFGLLTVALASGTRKAKVSGTVSYHGKPVTSGTVVMVGPDNVVCFGVIEETGTYEVDGVAAGDVKVAVTSPPPPDKVNPRRPTRRAMRSPERKQAPRPESSKWFPIPDSYGDAETSGLTATVTSRKATVDLDLK